MIFLAIGSSASTRCLSLYLLVLPREDKSYFIAYNFSHNLQFGVHHEYMLFDLTVSIKS